VASKPQKSHIPDFRQRAAVFRQVAFDVAWDKALDFAHEQRDFFVNRILAQDFDSFRVILYPESGTNLSPKWLARKRAAGADPRTMLATHHYIANIKVFQTIGPNGGQIRVGFQPGERARTLDNREKEITLERLARVHEYGSAHIKLPARPHWQPHLNYMKSVASRVRQEIVKEVTAMLGS
jgi:hypothetical protein